jgi:hypothetical protein
MKISEIIKQLRARMDCYGDVEVVFRDEGQAYDSDTDASISTVYYDEDTDLAVVSNLMDPYAE